MVVSTVGLVYQSQLKTHAKAWWLGQNRERAVPSMDGRHCGKYWEERPLESPTHQGVDTDKGTSVNVGRIKLPQGGEADWGGGSPQQWSGVKRRAKLYRLDCRQKCSRVRLHPGFAASYTQLNILQFLLFCRVRIPAP